MSHKLWLKLVCPSSFLPFHQFGVLFSTRGLTIPKMVRSRGWRPAAAAVMLLSTLVASSSSYTIVSAPAQPKDASWRYLHTPKTGTGFITVLRNFLDQCQMKDEACPGLNGGGFVSDISEMKAKSKKWSTANITCKGSLVACNVKDYHRVWTRDSDVKLNVVTMLRHPIRRLVSHHFWRLQPDYGRVHNDAKKWDRGLTTTLKAYNNMHLAMISGESWARGKRLKGLESQRQLQQQLDTARNRLFNPSSNTGVLWFGITDHWNASVCLFHHQFGGKARPSEFQNRREQQYNSSEVASLDMAMIRSFERWDMALYTDAYQVFQARAKAANCWTYKDEDQADALRRLTEHATIDASDL